MIVLAFTALVLVASVPLVSQLRTLDADRSAGRPTLATRLGATATRVVYSILVVAAFIALLIGWALSSIPTAALLPFLTAPLAMRLGDTVSHRAGAELGDAQREAVILLVAFLGLFGVGLAFPLVP